MLEQKKVQPFRGVRLEGKSYLRPLEIFRIVLLECLAPAVLIGVLTSVVHKWQHHSNRKYNRNERPRQCFTVQNPMLSRVNVGSAIWVSHQWFRKKRKRKKAWQDRHSQELETCIGWSLMEKRCSCQLVYYIIMLTPLQTGCGLLLQFLMYWQEN